MGVLENGRVFASQTIPGGASKSFRTKLSDGIEPEVGLLITMKIFRVSLHDLRSRRRNTHLVKARAFYVWAMRSLGTPRSYPAIARDLNKADHSVTWHLHRLAIAYRLQDEGFASACARLSCLFHEGKKHHAH